MSWEPAPQSSSLSLCISVSPHHSGGRPTKAFILQWAAQQKLHKHADSVLLMERKKRRLRKGWGRKRKGTIMKRKRHHDNACAVCLRERESTLNKEEDREIGCTWARRQTGSLRWIQRAEKWREREAVWATSRWMNGGKGDVVSPGRESCLAPARPEI